MQFEVKKTGLGKILARKGKEFVWFELVSNAWGEKASGTVASVCASEVAAAVKEAV